MSTKEFNVADMPCNKETLGKLLDIVISNKGVLPVEQLRFYKFCADLLNEYTKDGPCPYDMKHIAMMAYDLLELNKEPETQIDFEDMGIYGEGIADAEYEYSDISDLIRRQWESWTTIPIDETINFDIDDNTFEMRPAKGRDTMMAIRASRDASELMTLYMIIQTTTMNGKAITIDQLLDAPASLVNELATIFNKLNRI